MECEFLKRPGKADIAYRFTPASAAGRHLPPLMFLGGFRSDMTGKKATFFEAQCMARGQAFLRFDYSGHGQSSGVFKDGCISDWYNDAYDIWKHLGLNRPVLAGSSMGGWICLLLAVRHPLSVHGLLGIAAAPDFTISIWDEKLSPAQKQAVERDGFITEPSAYSDEPTIITRRLIEDGRDNNQVLNRVHDLSIPMRLVQGMEDPDVPWQTVQRIERAFPKADLEIVMIEDGDHSLSRPEDLEILDREIRSLSTAREIINEI